MSTSDIVYRSYVFSDEISEQDHATLRRLKKDGHIVSYPTVRDAEITFKRTVPVNTALNEEYRVVYIINTKKFALVFCGDAEAIDYDYQLEERLEALRSDLGKKLFVTHIKEPGARSHNTSVRARSKSRNRTVRSSNRSPGRSPRRSPRGRSRNRSAGRP